MAREENNQPQQTMPGEPVSETVDQEQPVHHSELINLGNSCYGNSVLQVLQHFQCEIGGDLLSEQSPLSIELTQLLNQMSASPRPISPENFFALCSQLSGGRWQGNAQEDSLEFLAFLIQNLLLRQSLLTRFVKVEKCQNVNCNFMLESPATGADFEICLLPIQQMTSDSVLFLDLFRTTESSVKKNSQKCPSCHKNLKSERLVIHPGQFSVFGIYRQNADNSKSKAKLIYNVLPEPYHLTDNPVSLVSHIGETCSGGHYISFARHGSWQMYNDSVVQNIIDPANMPGDITLVVTRNE